MSFLKRLLPFFLIVLFAVAAYSNSFSVPFQFDGVEYIEKNPYLKNFEHLPQVWFKGASHQARYVAYITFAANYQFGGLDVFGYHLVNLIIHIFNAFLIYWLVQLIYRTPKMNDGTGSQCIALAAALLFVTHPIQTQAVTYIVQRFASLATLFYLLSFCLYLKGRFSRQWVYFLLAGFVALLGMFTKQIVITLPVMILLSEYLFFPSFHKIRENKKTMIILILIILVFFLVIPGLYSFNFLNMLNMTAQSDSHDGDQLTRTTYFLTQLRVLSTYLRLIFAPFGQNLDYDYPMSLSLFDPPSTFFALLLHAGLLCLAAFLLKKKILLPAFGILWFYVSASVESSVLVIENVIFEHRMYLPSVGVFVSLAGAAALWFKREKTFMALTLAIAVVFGVLTFQRNKVWQSDIALWTDALEKSPDKSRPYKNLGIAFAKRGVLQRAHHYLSTAYRLTPDDEDAINNLANVYNRMGNKKKAKELYEEVLEIDPGHAAALNNLGSVYYDAGDYRTALIYYREAKKQDPINAQAYYNLANTYYVLGYKEKALWFNRHAVTFGPNHAQAHQNLGVLYAEKGEYERSLHHYHRAIELKPDYAQAHNNVAVVYLKERRYKEAIYHVDRARALGYQVNPAFLKVLEPHR